MARTTAELVMVTTLDLPREQQRKVLRLARALRAGSPAVDRLERMLLEGLDSGPACVAHSAYWARKKREWVRSARKRKGAAR
jgi:hypothetical protein